VDEDSATTEDDTAVLDVPTVVLEVPTVVLEATVVLDVPTVVLDVPATTDEDAVPDESAELRESEDVCTSQTPVSLLGSSAS
jgi:hypothetical protein